MKDNLSDYVERWGMAMEAVGLPRQSGRLLGWLHVCEPPEQSAADLARDLDASAGGISTAARQLIAFGYVERTGRAGDRRAYYRLRRDAWARGLAEQMGAMTTFRELADRGLATLDVQDDPQSAPRLADMRALFAFLETEFPLLVQRFFDQPRDER